MIVTLEQIDKWLSCREDEHVEFKEAKTQFSYDDLLKYVAALANERGGYIALGISPKIPRNVVGTQAFLNPARQVHQILQKTGLKIEWTELNHSDGRVLVLAVPSRPIGMPIPIDGKYWMRSGESLTAMTPDMLKRVFDEGVPDFSAEICGEAVIDDLDPVAIEEFRMRWIKKSGNDSLRKSPPQQLLEDAGLLSDGRVTYAALILLGTPKAINRKMARAEVVFEYRSTENPGPANQRVEFRQGFLTFFDELWNLINLRNDKQHYQDGLFVWDIPTFNERVCREAILNAVCHRDYRSSANVFVRQYARRLVVESPGGFPDGITLENILYRQNPRNRLLADNLARCGFVERSGQGADLMYRLSIEEGKAEPDFKHTDASGVFLTLHGTVMDPQFVRFIEKVSQETGESFGLRDLVLMASIRDGRNIPEDLRDGVPRLLELGVVERAGSRNFVLSKRFYKHINRLGEYTRRKGLDHQTNKELLLRHIRNSGSEGTRMEELTQVLPAKSRDQIKRMILELRQENLIHSKGTYRWTRWFYGPGDDMGAKSSNSD